MDIRRLDLTWALLLLATLLTWRIGEAESGGGVAAMAVVGLIAFLKGRAVALDFMGLRGVNAMWRALVLGWLIVVLGLVALAYWLALPG